MLRFFAALDPTTHLYFITAQAYKTHLHDIKVICSLSGEVIRVRGHSESDERSSHSKTYGVATRSVEHPNPTPFSWHARCQGVHFWATRAISCGIREIRSLQPNGDFRPALLLRGQESEYPPGDLLRAGRCAL